LRDGIVVLGGLRAELVIRTGATLCPGETVEGIGFQIRPGGGGANQAVAAARAGGKPIMVGRIGQDGFSQVIAKGLFESGVRGDLVAVAQDIPTGSTFIIEDQKGQRSTVIFPGANETCSKQDVLGMLWALEDAKVLLLQMELPREVSFYAARQAKERGVIVIMDPTPLEPISPMDMKSLDIVVPNRREASLLVGRPVVDLRTARLAAAELVDRGANAAVVTMGAEGVVYADASSTGYIAGHRVDAVDPSGAGDTFAGALAVAICQGKDLREACRFANAAAALCVTRRGVQESMPWRKEIERFLSDEGF
jgi:ribokinase